MCRGADASALCFQSRLGIILIPGISIYRGFPDIHAASAPTCKYKVKALHAVCHIFLHLELYDVKKSSYLHMAPHRSPAHPSGSQPIRRIAYTEGIILKLEEVKACSTKGMN